MQGFAQRLASQLEQQHMSQSRLAAALGVSRSTVTGWIKHGKLPDAFLIYHLCRALGCSADWLLGLESHAEQESDGIRWSEQIPPYVPEFQRQQIEYGIRVFHLLIRENRPAEQIYQPHNRAALQAALRSGAIRITQVGRNDTLEAKLKERYPLLKAVLVVDVPQKYDDTVIRTELVTFLAATQALTQTTRPNAVGLGGGYTMLRLCEQSIPGIDQFSGTKWLPLLSFSAGNTSDYIPNTLARLMAMRHAGSEALYLPHPDECVTSELKAAYEHTLRIAKNTGVMFLSVSNVERREHGGQAHLLSEFRSADYAAEAPYLREAYAKLKDKGEFGAEILRYLIDTNGHILSIDPAAGTQLDLETLRYQCQMMGNVWLVAARQYKAKSVLTCIRNRLANALVIDSEIAEWLCAV